MRPGAAEERILQFGTEESREPSNSFVLSFVLSQY
jgi:hypothetical protein